jgi:hypothetical protein
MSNQSPVIREATGLPGEDTDKQPIIMKRKAFAARGNARKKSDDDTAGTMIDQSQDSNDSDEYGIDKQKLEDLKLLHSVKKRREGISVETLAYGDKKDKKMSSVGDFKNSFASQFNSRMDHGLQTTVPHEKIMEEYINEKLGVKHDQSVV